jgi:hypothetical protein
MLSLYKEEAEAAYFGSDDELVERALRYIRDDVLRARVAAAGRERCLRDGHDVDSRARRFLRDIEPLVQAESFSMRRTFPSWKRVDIRHPESRK